MAAMDPTPVKIPVTGEIDGFVEVVKGPPGDPGQDGVDGRDGVDGKDGANGLDGVNGTDGRDGQPGRNGLDGRDGRDGADGVKGPTGDKGDPGDKGPTGDPGPPGGGFLIVREQLAFTDPRIGGVYDDLTLKQADKVQAWLDMSARAKAGREFGIRIEGVIRCERPVTNKQLVPIDGRGFGETWNASPAALLFDIDCPDLWTPCIDNGGPEVGRPIIMRNFTIGLPSHGRPGVAGLPPCNMAGPSFYTRAEVDCVRVHGGAAAGLSLNDHQHFRRFDGRGNGCWLHYMPNPFGGLGDMTFTECYGTSQTMAGAMVADSATVANATFAGNGHFGVSPHAIRRYRTPDIAVWADPGVTQIDHVPWTTPLPPTAKGVSITGLAPDGTPALPGGTTIVDFSGVPGDYSIVTSNPVNAKGLALLRLGIRPTVLVGSTFERWSFENVNGPVFYDEPGDGWWSELDFIGQGVASPYSGPMAWPGMDYTGLGVFDVGVASGWKFINCAMPTTSGRPIIRANQITGCHADVLNPFTRKWRPYALKGAYNGSQWEMRCFGNTAGPAHRWSGGRSAVFRRVGEALVKGEAMELTGAGGVVMKYRGTGPYAGHAGDNYAVGEISSCAQQFSGGGQVAPGQPAPSIGGPGVLNYGLSPIPQRTMIELDPSNPGGVMKALSRASAIGMTDDQLIPAAIQGPNGIVPSWGSAMVSIA
jgi:hypothetical protein